MKLQVFYSFYVFPRLTCVFACFCGHDRAREVAQEVAKTDRSELAVIVCLVVTSASLSGWHLKIAIVVPVHVEGFGYSWHCVLGGVLRLAATTKRQGADVADVPRWLDLPNSDGFQTMGNL